MLYAFNTLLEVVPKIEVRPEDITNKTKTDMADDSSDNDSDHNLKINEIQNNES